MIILPNPTVEAFSAFLLFRCHLERSVAESKDLRTENLRHTKIMRRSLGSLRSLEMTRCNGRPFVRYCTAVADVRCTPLQIERIATPLWGSQ